MDIIRIIGFKKYFCNRWSRFSSISLTLQCKIDYVLNILFAIFFFQKFDFKIRFQHKLEFLFFPIWFHIWIYNFAPKMRWQMVFLNCLLILRSTNFYSPKHFTLSAWFHIWIYNFAPKMRWQMVFLNFLLILRSTDFYPRKHFTLSVCFSYPHRHTQKKNLSPTCTLRK